MPVIAAVATAVPPYQISQREVRDIARERFRGHLPDIERYLTVFDNAAIDTRYLAAPIEWYLRPHGFGEANDLFVGVACRLGEDAARRCLEQAGIAATEVDHIFVVTTTGLATPSLDARLMLLLGMRPDTRRTPIWGLGCAGGMGGLARAQEYVRAFPTQRALLVTVELCSLTMQFDDHTKQNLVAYSLFGDGAAAVLVEGDEAARRPGPRVVDTRSTLFPDSLALMGWDVVDAGFRVVFGSRIPTVVTHHFRELATELLCRHGRRPQDIRHHIYHPGGAKVLRAYDNALGLAPDALAHSRAVLRDYGNMSSTTVLFVLERFLAAGGLSPGDLGLLSAFGPGFTADLALIEG